MEIRMYFQLLQKGWWVILLTGLIALISSLTLSMMATPQYQSTARFIITPSLSLTTSKDVMDSLNTLDRESVVATYAEVMGSKRIFVDSLASMQLDSSLIDNYHVQAVVLPSSSVIELTISGPNPEIAAELANVIGYQTISFSKTLNFVFTVNFLDEAVPSTTPYTPQPSRDAALAAFLGIFFGAAATIAGEQIRIPLDAYRQRLRVDSATGVYNKQYFTRTVDEEIIENPDENMTIGIIELSGLRDLLGSMPPSGSQQLLNMATETLRKELRGNDIIGLWNNISFCIMLPATPGMAATRTFERIFQALSIPVTLSRYDLTVRFDPHIGGAVYNNYINSKELLQKVENSLEEAGRNTSNPVTIWEMKSPFWVANEKNS